MYKRDVRVWEPPSEGGCCATCLVAELAFAELPETAASCVTMRYKLISTIMLLSLDCSSEELSSTFYEYGKKITWLGPALGRIELHCTLCSVTAMSFGPIYIQWPFGRADYAHSHYGPSGGIVIFDTQDSNRKSHEIGESAINPSQSIICNCAVLVRVLNGTALVVFQ